MRQQPCESVSPEWEESSRRQDARAIWCAGAHLQAALQRQISLRTFLLLVTTVLMTLISMEVLFAAGVLVGVLLAPHLMMHGMQAAPVQP